MRFGILGIVLLSVGVSLAQDHEVQQIPSKAISNYGKLFEREIVAHSKNNIVLVDIEERLYHRISDVLRI